MSNEPISFSRRAAVQSRFCFSRSTLWRKIKAGEFPRPVRLGPQLLVWPDNELDDYAEALVVERDAAEA